MKKRLLTIKQEQIIKLCHHDHQGLSSKEAAKVLGITESSVNQLLARAKQAAPQLFPILTKLQAQVYHLLTVEGLSPQEIAEQLGTSRDSVYKTLQACKKKGFVFPNGRNYVTRYEPWMDDEVKEKF
jgi:DNA-directed RNA polymerase specialized sigma24 family protein